MLYFAYGANLNLRGMKRRCPQAKPMIAATLQGHRLEFRTFITIVPDARGAVTGALYDLTPACLRALDHYEGESYTQIAVTVETADGPRDAVTYIMPAGTRTPPGVQYFTEIARGYADWKLDVALLRKARIATLHPEKPKPRPLEPGPRGGAAR